MKNQVVLCSGIDGWNYKDGTLTLAINCEGESILVFSSGIQAENSIDFLKSKNFENVMVMGKLHCYGVEAEHLNFI